MDNFTTYNGSDRMTDITSKEFDSVDKDNSSFEETINKNLENITKALHSIAGNSKDSSLIRQISGFDMIGNSQYMMDVENSGITFFTRPKLNLTTTSIRHDRILSLLDINEKESMAFAIRCLLDTNYSRRNDIGKLVENNPLFNPNNPFIPILTNQLKTISGWPDYVLETETSEGGFHSENITYPKGSDDLNRTSNLTASFNDVQGSFILFLFYLWIKYIALSTKGIVTQYPEDIESKRLGYTFSIYRFVLDTSKRFITKWSKATGCFINSVPIGSYFNFDRSNPMTTVGNDLSIPIVVAGKIEYMDWIVLKEFNMLVKRFSPEIEDWKQASYGDYDSLSEQRKIDHDNEGHIFRNIANYHCIPYIDTTNGMNELQWRYPNKDNIFDGSAVINKLHSKLKF